MAYNSLLLLLTTGFCRSALAFQSSPRHGSIILVPPNSFRVGVPVVPLNKKVSRCPHHVIRQLPEDHSCHANNKHKRVRLGGLFASWYALSIAYNIFSKKALNAAPEVAWTAAFFQMFLGLLLYVGPLWLSKWRIMPRLSLSDWRKLSPVAAWHSLVHVGGVVSMGAGTLSFTYVVKASEPAVSALLSVVILRQVFPLSVYATLLPVMGGVALASVSELSFSWKSFNYAMMSNIASSARAVTGKTSMRLGRNMDARNTYAIVTMMSSAMLLPIATALEGSLWASTWKTLQASGQLRTYAWQTIAASLFYYTYNEVAFLCLDEVSTVSHALANTLKRIFIIFASVLIFGNRITPRGMLGSAVAICGVFLYSLAKERAEKQVVESRKEIPKRS